MEPQPFRIELTPLTFLRRNATALGERTAVVHGERRYDYAELGRALQPARLGAARARPREARPRRGAVPEHRPPLLEAHFGVPARRRRPGPHEHARERARSSRYILEDSGARSLIVDHALADARRGRRPDVETIVVQDTGEPDDPYEELLAAGSTDEPVRAGSTDEDEPISINYTSGTTGKPKGAVYTHRGAYLRAHGVALETRLAYDSVHLWTLPMFHCDGWCLTWGVTAAGGRARVPAQGRAGAHLGAVRAPRASRTTAARPTIHNSIVNHDGAHPLEQRVTVPTRRLAALADAAREDARAQPAPDPPLRADRDLRAR